MRRRSWRVSLAWVAGFVLFALTWLSVAFVRLESSARLDAEVGEAVRLALWRMDSWLTAQLSSEMTADPGTYAPRDPAEAKPWVLRYFDSEVDGAAGWPTGSGWEEVEARIDTFEAKLPEWQADAPPNFEWPSEDQAASRQEKLSRNERNQRSKVNMQSQWMANDLRLEAQPGRVGPLVPMWGPNGELAFARQVEGSGAIQGFLVDWSVLQGVLLEQVQDLMPKARLEPVRQSVAGQGEEDQLAALPARLIPGRLPGGGGGIAGAALTTLLVSWLCALLALGAVGYSLRASESYAERRSRFASTVTHELRTPLTTFRMYSEMLARDMVDEGQRQEYLETLRRESDRLARLVENVLAYARIEEGRHVPQRRQVTVADLIERNLPVLEAHALAAGALFEWDLPKGARESILTTDVDAVGQVLFNLLDNACKYGCDAGGVCDVRLHVACSEQALVLVVQDAGAGVPGEDREAIFGAFERGARGLEEPNAGIGLGLALAREIARHLGGELRLEASVEGARFELSLPMG